LTIDFWKTFKGLLARLADLSHHMTWSSLNVGVKETVAVTEPIDPETLEPHKLIWITIEDERVWGLCEENAGEYDMDEDFIPIIPAHVMCRADAWRETRGSQSDQDEAETVRSQCAQSTPKSTSYARRRPPVWVPLF